MTPTIKDHLFDRAIFISLIFHALLFLVVVGINFPQWQKKQQRKDRVEISYRRVKSQAIDVKEHPIKPVQQLDLNQEKMLPSNGQGMPVPLTKAKGQLPAGLMTDGKSERWRSISSNRKRITITPISVDKINNPAYAAYNEIVRSRIKDRVDLNYEQSLNNSEVLESGRVYLTFMISNSGQLKAFQVIHDRSNATEHLKEISLQSLQQAGPFPPFLKGMTLPEYTFNIEVQYNQ